MFMRQVILLLLVVCIGIFIGSMIGYTATQRGGDLNELLVPRAEAERKANSRALAAQALIETNIRLRDEERFVRRTLAPIGVSTEPTACIHHWTELARSWRRQREFMVFQLAEWLKTTHNIDLTTLDPDRDLNLTPDQFAALKAAIAAGR